MKKIFITLVLTMFGFFVYAQPQPNTITGRATDASGNPIAGAYIWVNPAVTTGLYETRTDENGYFEAKGLPPVGYNVYGWFEKDYQDKTFCLRLGYETIRGYDTVVPTDTEGVSVNLVWQLQGHIEDMIGDQGIDYFGGRVSVFLADNYAPARNLPLEFTFTPVQPLIDGSTGQTLVLTPDAKGYLLDIPVGVYKVTATLNGQNIQVGSEADTLAGETTLEFDPEEGGCGGGNYGNGVAGAYLYVGAGNDSSAENPLNTEVSYADDDISDDSSDDTTSSMSGLGTALVGGMAGNWEGTLTYSGTTFYVRYELKDGEHGDGFVNFTGVVLECPIYECTEVGSVTGQRVSGGGASFTTTLYDSGASFVTDGSFEGETFVGLTDAVFDSQQAQVTLESGY